MFRRWTKSIGLSLAGLFLLGSTTGCPTDSFFANFTAEITGNVNLALVNNTDARVIFSMGTWNGLDRGFPFLIDFAQPAVEPASTVNTTLTCDRIFAVGTQALLDWVPDTNADDQAGFQSERLTAEVQFRLVDPDLSADAAPLLGTAAGFEVALGNDFSCNDQIIISFVEDPAQPGGYRVDYQVIRVPDDELDVF